jgi:succinate dehydrogenase/fumarate reductase flavoprotein subunit
MPRRLSQLDRFQVLIEEHRNGTVRVSRSLAVLSARIDAARKALEDCAVCLKVSLEARSRDSYQRLARAERLLSQAREQLSETGWTSLEISGETKRLQAEIKKLSRRFEIHEKAHAT